MNDLISVNSENEIVVNQEKLKEAMNLESYSFDKQLQFMQEAINQSLIQQAGKVLKASLLNREYYKSRWLNQKRSEATKKAYNKAIGDFFDYIDGIGVSSPILVEPEHIDDYLEELKFRYSDNSIRARISSCASFYSYLRRMNKVHYNPFHSLPLPKKHYKKAIKTDQTKTIPVMSSIELDQINSYIHKRINHPGNRSCDQKIREGSKRLILAVHFMSQYGLRAGAVATIRIQDDRFSYITKGDKSGSKPLLPITMKLLSQMSLNPLVQYKKISMQLAFKNVTVRLSEGGIISYPYSCHDLRHYFANDYYLRTKDIVGLRDEMDHASINVTDIYLQNIGLK